MQGDNYQVDKEPLLEIPIHLVRNKDLIKKMVDLIDDITVSKKAEKSSKTSRDMDFYRRKSRSIESQIDLLVYNIYGLDTDEINIITKE